MAQAASCVLSSVRAFRSRRLCFLMDKLNGTLFCRTVVNATALIHNSSVYAGPSGQVWPNISCLRQTVQLRQKLNYNYDICYGDTVTPEQTMCIFQLHSCRLMFNKWQVGIIQSALIKPENLQIGWLYLCNGWHKNLPICNFISLTCHELFFWEDTGHLVLMGTVH